MNTLFLNTRLSNTELLQEVGPKSLKILMIDKEGQTKDYLSPEVGMS